MNSNKTVLALVDLTESYEDVLYAALLYAGSSDANLLIYHAIPKSISQESVNDIKKRFESRIAQVSNELDLDIQDHEVIIAFEEVANGKVLKQLLSRSELVVIGAGDSKTSIVKREKIIKIVDLCPQSVLVIPHKGRLNKPERILYCSSYLELNSDSSLQVIKDIAKRFNSEIRVAHVKTHSGSSKTSKVDRSRFEGKYFEPEVKYAHKLIRNSDVIEGINHYIQKKGDNDLVVMIRRNQHVINRIFAPNFTNKMLKKTEIPLLILKENQLNSSPIS